MFLDRVRHAGKTLLKNGARHSKIETHISFCVSDKEAVPAFQKDTRFVGEERGQIRNVRQCTGKIHPGKIGGFRDPETRLGITALEKAFRKTEIVIQICFQLRQPLTAGNIRCLMGGKRQWIEVGLDQKSVV